MGIKDLIKNNMGSIAAASIGSIITIVSTLFTLDARYAHADDVDRDKIEIRKIIKDTSYSSRRQMLEDKIFELDLRREQSYTRRLSPVDSALRDRYERQISELDQTKDQ